MEIKSLELWLGTDMGITSADAAKIRGFMGRKYVSDTLFHNHREDGTNIYRYPLVQYKIIDGIPLLIGIEDGIKSLWTVFDEMTTLTLDSNIHEIFDKKSELRRLQFELAHNKQSYTFFTPWLALNEKNYDQYRKLRTWLEKKALLEKVLIGNIISMSKSLGYTVPEPIKANIGKMKEVPTTLKGTPMLGFLGSFSVNFEIPDYWGIGKSVSRGFGTVVKQRTDDR